MRIMLAAIVGILTSTLMSSAIAIGMVRRAGVSPEPVN